MEKRELRGVISMDKNLKTALIIGGIVIAVLVILSVVPGLIGGWQGYGFGMMGPWMMGGYGAMFLMPILWIVAIGLIVWAVVAGVRGSNKSGSSDSDPGRADTALEVLKRRYARGEIDKDEFEAKKKDLV
jgi:putative membrane protein